MNSTDGRARRATAEHWKVGDLMRLVLIGPPGSGKGTQAEMLVKRLGLTYVGTGDILRAAIREKTPVGQLAEPIIKQGMLVPDAVVNDLVAELFRSTARPERFVMDGYPRTYAQAIAFDALLNQQYLRLDAVVEYAVSDDEVVGRISSRRCCENKDCAICYNLFARKPKVDNTCDKCGSKLMIRDDDKEETVRRRLVEFHNNTDQLLEHYRRRNLLKSISALDPPDTIYANTLKAMGV